MGTINTVFPVSSVGTDKTVTPVTGNNNLTSFEAIVALEDTQSLLGVSSASGSGTSTQVDVGLQNADLLNLNSQALDVLTGINNTPIATPASSITVAQEVLEYKTTQALLDVSISSASGLSSTAGLSGADFVNLSPAALNVINGVQEGISISADTTTPLTPVQLQHVTNLLAQYANTPLNQTTLTQLIAALTELGLDPAQISVAEMLQASLLVPAPISFQNEELITESESVQESLSEQLDEA